MRTFIAALLAASAYAADSIGSYDYSEGGENWQVAYAKKEGNVCGTGNEQSPIDLTDGEEASISIGIAVNKLGTNPYTTVDKDAVDADGVAKKVYMPTNWHTNLDYGNADKDTYDPENHFVRRGPGALAKYVPLQFHLHTPSEHTVGGKHHDVEMHIVHMSPPIPNGQLAVIGIFFDVQSGENAENEVIDALIAKEVPDLESLYEAIQEKTVWMYDGSLTTPPCSEGVKWTVINEALPITQAQLDELSKFTKGTLADDVDDYTTQAILNKVKTNSANEPIECKEALKEGEECEKVYPGGNNRAVQSLNDRTLYKKTALKLEEGASTLMASAAAIAAISLLSF